jgi:hypothetical protein
MNCDRCREQLVSGQGVVAGGVYHKQSGILLCDFCVCEACAGRMRDDRHAWEQFHAELGLRKTLELAEPGGHA